MSDRSDAILATQVRHWNDVFDWAGRWVRELVTRDHTDAETVILDVGAGQGKYRVVLPEYARIYACEVWRPTIENEHLTALYQHVFVGSIVDLVSTRSWDTMTWHVIIMGDVLEHLDVADAQVVLERCYERCDDVIVVIPYLYAQGPEDGNEYQRHLQDDLTPEVMMARYPDLRLIAIDAHPDGRTRKGLYRRYV